MKLRMRKLRLQSKDGNVSSMETFELDKLPELDHDMLDIFRDAATWPNPVSDSMRVELVSRGPLWLQNKDGPSLKTRTIEICLQIGFIKSRKSLFVYLLLFVSAWQRVREASPS